MSTNSHDLLIRCVLFDPIYSKNPFNPNQIRFWEFVNHIINITKQRNNTKLKKLWQTNVGNFTPNNSKSHESEVLSPPELGIPQVTTSPFSKTAAKAWEVDWMCFTSFLKNANKWDVSPRIYLAKENVTTLRMKNLEGMIIEGLIMHHCTDVSRDVSTTPVNLLLNAPPLK